MKSTAHVLQEDAKIHAMNRSEMHTQHVFAPQDVNVKPDSSENLILNGNAFWKKVVQFQFLSKDCE